ncbi:RNA-splicing factor [Cichlidogyrus casuarinus]|uniref:RNA-splicing factor n=1 Tax=Cichlidogyrus casuarinus TaxID=1844966 RepID=A0ABD2QFY5_9PLAT
MAMLSQDKDKEGGTKWMYEEPQANPEEYLLGKKINKVDDVKKLRKVEQNQDETPEARFARLDMQMKFREDPLTLMKQSEHLIQAQCLQNTAKMKKLQRLLKIQEEQKKKRKKHKKDRKEKKRKKRESSSESSCDELLKEFIKIVKNSETGAEPKAQKPESQSSTPPRRESPPRSRRRSRSRSPRREKKLTREDKERKRLEMMSDAKERELVRSERSKQHKDHVEREYHKQKEEQSKHGASFVKNMTLNSVSSMSLEESVNRNFARHQRSGKDDRGFYKR